MLLCEFVEVLIERFPRIMDESLFVREVVDTNNGLKNRLGREALS